jgi:phosphatidylglycerol:prolipoprotein diacylglycerol transferase
MHPILLEIGPVAIHAYGFFIAAGFLLGMAWIIREARQRGLNDRIVHDFAFFALIAAIVGSRLFYVAINLDHFLANPLDIVMFWKGGLVFSGAVLAAGALVVAVLKYKGQPLGPWADAVAPGLALGQAVGRLGCFSAGCCFGKACDLPWAVTFTDPNSLAPLYTGVHPTQLYHSLAGLAIFLVILAAKRRFQVPGRIFGLYLALFSTLRFIIEFFRGDYRGDLGFLSVTQVVALCIFATGAWLLIRKPKGEERVG